MAKKIFKIVKLQAKGGNANPSPPIGPALGSAGVNIMEFCKQFNVRTQNEKGRLVPVLITIYDDKSFDFIIKTIPTSAQLIEVSKIEKGSSEPNRTKVGKVTWEQIDKIAQNKMQDLNCFTLQSARNIIAGTARSMGLEVIK